MTYIKLCLNCGAKLDREYNISAKYCKSCAKEITKAQTRERMRKYRERKANSIKK